MRVRNWWLAAMGVAATGALTLAQSLPGGAVPVPTLPAGPLPVPSGASPIQPAGPVAPAPLFQPADLAPPPAPLPGPLPAIPPGPALPTPTAPVVPSPPVGTPPTLVAPAPAAVPMAPPASAGSPTLSVKQLLPDAVAPGQPVSAEITVTNTGSKVAENVVLTGWWTAGYDIADQSVASQTLNGRRAWGLGAIAAGEARAVRLKLVPSTNAPPTAEFRIGFDAALRSAVADTQSIKVLKPELKVAVAAPDQVFVGQPVPLQIKVTNASSFPVQKMVVQSFMSGGVAYPKMPAGAGNGLASDPVSLQAGGADVIALDLAATRAGDGKVVVRVSADGADPVTHEVTVKVAVARVGVTLHGPKSLYRNWPGTYEAVIENQGEYPIRGAAFEVKLPSGLVDNLRASDKPGYDAGNNRLVWKFDVLQPGEKRTVLWFGYSKQTDDLLTTGTATMGGIPLKRAEWTTKNLGAEAR